MTARSVTRTQERTIEPAGSDIRWFSLYASLSEFGSALAYPCRWNTATNRWVENTTAARRTIYSTVPGVTASADDIVPCRYNPWGRRWEVIGQTGSMPDLVQVRNDLVGTEVVGDLQSADANGYHYGQIVRWIGGVLTDSGACWIRFLDWESVDTGQVIAEYGRNYGPFRLSGTATSQLASVDTTLPLYTGEISEQNILCKSTSGVSKGASASFDLYNGDETDSGINKTAKALFNAYTANKWAIMSRIRGGTWYVQQVEC